MNNAELIKELRALTQAGMKDCRDALEEAAGDLEKAIDIIKVKGLNIVTSREGKVASEGQVISIQLDYGPFAQGMIEINCQTESCANSTEFQEFANLVRTEFCNERQGWPHEGENPDELVRRPFQHNSLVIEAARRNLIAITKENIMIRRWWVEEINPEASIGRVFSYVHANNKIGVLLSLQASSGEIALSKEFRLLGEDLALQVAAMNPLAVNPSRLPVTDVLRQTDIFNTQVAELNKPFAAQAKILSGKLNKWHTEVCLLNQESVVNPLLSVAGVIDQVSTKLGGKIQVLNFIRCQVGEGIETVKENFADEVAKLI